MIKTLDEAKKKSNAYNAIEKELTVTKRKLETLEQTVNRQNRLSSRRKELLTIPINTIGLSSRLVNICSNAKITLVSDLVVYTRSEFLKIRNCGEVIVGEVDMFLNEKGLSWGMEI